MLLIIMTTNLNEPIMELRRKHQKLLRLIQGIFATSIDIRADKVIKKSLVVIVLRRAGIYVIDRNYCCCTPQFIIKASQNIFFYLQFKQHVHAHLKDIIVEYTLREYIYDHP